jgi:hypothetical protein
MKFLKNILRIAYFPVLAFGIASLMTGFISVFKALMNFNTINSFSELISINTSTFDVYIKPLTIVFVIIFLGLALVLKLIGNEHLIKENMPF